MKDSTTSPKVIYRGIIVLILFIISIIWNIRQCEQADNANNTQLNISKPSTTNDIYGHWEDDFTNGLLWRIRYDNTIGYTIDMGFASGNWKPTRSKWEKAGSLIIIYDLDEKTFDGIEKHLNGTTAGQAGYSDYTYWIWDKENNALTACDWHGVIGQYHFLNY